MIGPHALCPQVFWPWPCSCSFTLSLSSPDSQGSHPSSFISLHNSILSILYLNFTFFNEASLKLNTTVWVPHILPKFPNILFCFCLPFSTYVWYTKLKTFIFILFHRNINSKKTEFFSCCVFGCICNVLYIEMLKKVLIHQGRSRTKMRLKSV